MARKNSLDDMKFLHDMIVKLDVRLDGISEVQVRQEVTLEDHVRRSKSNEEQLRIMDRNFNIAQGVGATITGLSILVALVLGLKELLHG